MGLLFYLLKKVVVHIPNINLSQKNINLDLQHTGYTNTIYAQQGDVDSRQLTISLYDDGKNYNIPQDATVSLCGTRADKTVIYRDVDSFQNNVVTINFENAELAAKGIAQYKIEIKTTNENGQTQLLTSSAFKIKIYKNIYDENGKLASPQYSDLQRELDAMHKQEDEMKKATQNTINATNDLQNKLDSHHFVLTEDKDIAGGVAGLDSNTKVPNNKLYEASTSTKGITQLTDSVASNSSSLAATAKAVKTAYDKAASTENALNTHNSSTDAHEDIRDLISGLTSRLNALADSDDTTLDQLSEIVSYIKANRSLIDSVTTSKINVSDIVDNLTSTAANKVLSAKQGKVLNDLISSLNTAVGNKVDKVSGKGLSTNDYTTAEKNKLANIASGAEVNVQADWSETTTTSDSYIKNKPAIPTVGNGTVTIKQAGTAKGTFTMNQSGDTTIELTDNNTTYSNATTSANGLMSKDDKTKLDGIASGAEVNVQSDWNVTDTSSDAYIKNRPTIPAAVRVKGNKETTYRTGDVNITSSDIGAVSTSGGEFTGDVIFDKYAIVKAWSGYGSGSAKMWYNGNTQTLDFDGEVKNIDLNATSATNADTVDGKHASDLQNYNNLTNKPTIPTKTSQLTNDSGFKTTDTTYGVVSKTANGLVPKLPNETTTTKYLRQDGTWTVPPDTNTTYSEVTTSANGLMSATDKQKLDGVANNANNYSLPAASSSTRGGVKTGYSANGKNYPIQLSSEKMYVNVPWTDTTYNDATPSTHGLMSAADKKKLDGIISEGEYEEGTWTPTYGYMASSYQFTLSAGTYTKIGNVVIARCTVSPGSKDGSYEIYINPSSLPFTFNGKNFVLAILQDIYNGVKTDGRSAGAVGSIALGNKSFSVSNASTSTYYATIIYCV